MTIIAAGNKTGTGIIQRGNGRLLGLVVATSTSGTLKVMDSLDGSAGRILINTTSAITAPVAWNFKGDFRNGLYVTVGGTINFTAIYAMGEPDMRKRIVAAGNLSSDTAVYVGAARLHGFFVASSSSGTVRIFDNTAASGTVILNTTGTLGIGWYPLCADTVNGIYLDVGGTINVTVCYEINLPAG